MNPHYHPYTELPSPHSPPPDNNNYQHMSMSNGHLMSEGPHPDHHVHHHGSPFGGLHQHHLNNNTSNNNNNNNNGVKMECNGVKICGGCGLKIVERFYLQALDRNWHNNCLKCTCCHAMLADIGSSCYTKGGMILCKVDYIRLFGTPGSCSACGQAIPANEFVMRTGGSGAGPQLQSHHVFHLKCFNCSKCGAQLYKGDRYYLLAGSLVCEQDWHKLLKSTGVSGTPGTTTVRKGKVGRPRRSRD